MLRIQISSFSLLKIIIKNKRLPILLRASVRGQISVLLVNSL